MVGDAKIARLNLRDNPALGKPIAVWFEIGQQLITVYSVGDLFGLRPRISDKLLHLHPEGLS
jgi:hypothetical protein